MMSPCRDAGGQGVSQDETLSQLVVLKADISGSTRLYEQFGDELARADIAACLALLGDIAAARGGRVLQLIGDEVVCGFTVAAQAVAAAIDMHQRLREASAAGRFRSGRLRVKVGIHHGLAEWRDGQLVGATPALAEQVISLARPEEILLSGAAVEALPTALAATAQRLDTVEAKTGGAPLTVHRLPWEQDEDVTQFRVSAAATATTSRRRLTLDHDGQSVVVDAAHGHCRIGRTPGNDLVVDSPFTSRQHAEIRYRNGSFRLRDDSINGTFVRPESGPALHLHHEEGVVDGCGVLLFGRPRPGEPETLVRYRCE